MSPRNAELLKDAKSRPADISFGKSYDLDLGGVSAHLEALDRAFNEALGCAIHSAQHGRHTETVFEIDARAILDGSYFGEKQGE